MTASTAPAPVSVEFFELADDIIERLRPDRAADPLNPKGKMIYRGHADAAWKLTPSALRDGPAGFDVFMSHVRGPHAGLRIPEEHLRPTRWVYELLALRNFVDSADRIGIQLPEDGHAFRSELDVFKVISENTDADRPRNWPRREHLPTLALAQHYGIPTRLLDWSRNPLVAAYFAAREAGSRVIQHNDTNGNIAIWCLAESATRLQNSKQYQFGDGFSQLELIELPGGLNPNLAAQQGVFTLATTATAGDALESIVGGESLEKLELPKVEAPRLLWLLSQLRIDGSYLFPSLDGVARRTHEAAIWRWYSLTSKK